MLTVGLTGGIASGKTTIGQIFSNLGISIIDTDVISHQLMQKGQPAYLQTVQHFSRQILHEDNTINRLKLRKIIFSQPQQKTWLEDMLHPLIKKEALKNIERMSDNKYILLIVPLMFETGFDQLADYIIAIDCSVETQIQRLTQRDGIERILAQNMIAAQIDNQTRLSKADSSITNDDDESREQDVLTLHQNLLALGDRQKHTG